MSILFLDLFNIFSDFRFFIKILHFQICMKKCQHNFEKSNEDHFYIWLSHFKARVVFFKLCFNYIPWFIQYLFRISGFSSKFCIFRFPWKNVNIILKNQMKIIFGFDQCIWKLLLLSLNVVSIASLNSFNISSGFPDDFHHTFQKYDMCQ